MIPECKASPHGRHFFNFFNDCGGFDKFDSPGKWACSWCWSFLNTPIESSGEKE